MTDTPTTPVTPMANERTYTTGQGLKAGLRAQGLGHMIYEKRNVPSTLAQAGVDGAFAATVFVHLQEDVEECNRRGFTAVIDPERAAK